MTYDRRAFIPDPDHPLTGADLQIHHAEEWAALYARGQLVTVGETYVVEERAFELLGVTVVQDPAFLRGQTQKSGVAATLEELEEYRAEAAHRQAVAAQLRRQAQVLLAEADELAKG